MNPPADPVERFRRDLEALTGPLETALGIALSGGPDSLALLLLANAAFPGRVRAATVDHGLRPEAAAEADLAGRHCAALGVPHAILRAQVAEAGEGVQAAARRARYQALGDWLESEAIAILLTAHHADDQAETLVMRLLRGSGVGGLAGIRRQVPLGDGAQVCRPLLGWRRAELAEVVRAAGLEAADDPSNRDEAFDRARIRRLLGEAPWLDAAALARSAVALAEAEQALDWASRRLFDERAEATEASLSLSPEGLPPELLRRVLLAALRHIAPDAAPRGEQLTDLLNRLRAGGAATLAGVRCTGGEPWRFEPAPPRRGG